MEEKRGSFACPTCGNDLPIVAKQSVVGVWCETCRHFVPIVWAIKPSSNVPPLIHHTKYSAWKAGDPV